MSLPARTKGHEMNRPPSNARKATLGRVLPLVVLALLTRPTLAQPRSPQPTAETTRDAMTQHAKGSFDVKVTPQPLNGPAEDADLGRFALEKQFHGDLDGTGMGQMLTAGGPSQGSGGYVAMERVRGTLGGRRGAFVFQHSGTMTPASQTITVTVVPGSGTDELVGLAGELTITIAAGKHTYDFAYTLPSAKQ